MRVMRTNCGSLLYPFCALRKTVLEARAVIRNKMRAVPGVCVGLGIAQHRRTVEVLGVALDAGDLGLMLPGDRRSCDVLIPRVKTREKGAIGAMRPGNRRLVSWPMFNGIGLLRLVMEWNNMMRMSRC